MKTVADNLPADVSMYVGPRAPRVPVIEMREGGHPPLVAAVRAKGSDASDVRDAAHEACHALSWGVKKKWTRNNIHAKKPRVRSEGVADEILARAVEQIVCADLGVECGSIEKWAMVCWMEMLKNERISLPTDGWLVESITSAIKSKRARAMADRILSLVEPTK